MAVACSRVNFTFTFAPPPTIYMVPGVYFIRSKVFIVARHQNKVGEPCVNSEDKDTLLKFVSVLKYTPSVEKLQSACLQTPCF